MNENTRWSGEFHIVDTSNGTSLESWRTRQQAEYFCEAVNDHEAKNNRARVFVVEEHPIAWRHS